MQDIPKSDSLERDVQRVRELLLAFGRKQSLRDPLATTVEELGLTPPQLHAVFWLGNDGALTMGELARRIGITEKTVTGVVDRLERDGHAQRERDEQDRRVVRVRLSPGGAALHKTFRARMTEKMTWLLGLLDEPDRRDLFRILETLLSRAAADATPPSEGR
ncbi:MAG TPA: MarR family transcriptional regulator [Myxococcaceae bacterium]|nr:MarR family transcriptional regulator [Myxococcaceae bacterium]